uniref:Uncharacterized protein n=1 Tax=Bubo bubo TaxID=30461 RepID=A0A8C0I9J0_BUBBB
MLFVIHIRDSYAAHEPQELTVSGGARSAHISGLLDYTGYDINIKGTTNAGVHTEPLTAFVMTGTCLKVWSLCIDEKLCFQNPCSFAPPEHKCLLFENKPWTLVF